MIEEGKRYASQKVKSTILKARHEKRSDRQVQFRFKVHRKAACQNSEEIFDGC